MEAQSNCLTNGELRAFADDAVTRECWSTWAMHIDHCANCRERLARIVDNADAVATMLYTIAPSPNRVDEDLALRQVHARRGARESSSFWLKGIGL